jgi:hypothetical protein
MGETMIEKQRGHTMTTPRNRSFGRPQLTADGAAYHEAGHTLATYACGGHVEYTRVHSGGGATDSRYSIQRRRAGKDKWEYHPRSMRQFHYMRLAGLFAGPIAESRISENLSNVKADVNEMLVEVRQLFPREDDSVNGRNDDNYLAQFDAMVLVLAMASPTCEKALAAMDVAGGRALIDIKIVRVLVRSARLAHKIVDRNWPTVQSLATNLLKTGKLDRKGIEDIIEPSACRLEPEELN